MEVKKIMLKVEVNEKGGIDMTAVGDVATLVADVSIIVGGIYEKLKASNEKCADAFKNILKDAVNDDVVFITNEEEFEIAKKKRLEKDKKKIDDLMQSLFDSVFKKNNNTESEDGEDETDADVAEDDEDIEEPDDEDVNSFFDNLMKDLKDINCKLDKLDKATRCNRFSRNKK